MLAEVQQASLDLFPKRQWSVFVFLVPEFEIQFRIIPMCRPPDSFLACSLAFSGALSPRSPIFESWPLTPLHPMLPLNSRQVPWPGQRAAATYTLWRMNDPILWYSTLPICRSPLSPIEAITASLDPAAFAPASEGFKPSVSVSALVPMPLPN
jgi:hypothetical protein